MDITSLQNPKIKEAYALRDRRDRDRTKLFMIEGFREITRAVLGRVNITRLFFAPDFFLGENEGALIEQIQKQGAELFSCSSSVFAKLSYRDRPDGLLAIAQQMPTDFFAVEHATENPFFLVAEAIEKPGNLGTILRSADAVGVDGVIVADRCTDLFNPNVVRASVGTLFTQPVWEASSRSLLAFFRQNHIAVIAATPHAREEFTQVDLTQPLAIVVGTEQVGLSPIWMEDAQVQVRIPMRGVADSLNVATATTLLLYEVLRQRSGGGRGPVVCG